MAPHRTAPHTGHHRVGGGEDLAPKNELCDEFLFTSHIVAPRPLRGRPGERHGEAKKTVGLVGRREADRRACFD